MAKAKGIVIWRAPQLMSRPNARLSLSHLRGGARPTDELGPTDRDASVSPDRRLERPLGGKAAVTARLDRLLS